MCAGLYPDLAAKLSKPGPRDHQDVASSRLETGSEGGGGVSSREWGVDETAGLHQWYLTARNAPLHPLDNGTGVKYT